MGVPGIHVAESPKDLPTLPAFDRLLGHHEALEMEVDERGKRPRFPSFRTAADLGRKAAESHPDPTALAALAASTHLASSEQ